MALNIDYLTEAEKKRLEEFKETLIIRKKAGILIGAGISLRSGMPDGKTLAAKLAKIGGVPEGELISVCDNIENKQGMPWLKRKLAELLDDETKSPSDIHYITSRTPYSYYLTTNLDRLMERAIEHVGKSYAPIFLPQDMALFKGDKIPVIKFHGTVEHPHTMVFSTKDFQKFSQKKPAFENLLRHLLSATSLLIVGYNASDQDFLDILRWIQSVSGSAEHIIIDFGREHQRKELLELGCFLVDLGAGRYDLLPSIMGFLAGMNEMEAKAFVMRVAKQPKIIKSKLGKLRHLPSFEKSKELFTPQIASTMDVVVAEYCPENRQLTLKIKLDDPGVLEQFKILSNLKRKYSEDKSKSLSKTKIEILPLEKRKLLGLLAVGGLPLKPIYFTQFFPDIDWKKEFRKFLRDGLLKKRDNKILISKRIEKTILSDHNERKSLHLEWIKVLEPLKYYVDIPLILAPHYIALKKFDEAIMVMVDILTETERGWENDLYLSIFESIAESKILNKINSDTRVHFYNTMGLCSTRTGKHMKAVKWYSKLRSYSKRIDHLWGIGQSYINCGVTYFEDGDMKKAEKCYQKAVAHGRGTDDKWLLGRALHNLAMTIYSNNMDKSIQLMNESLKIKEEVEDFEGIAAALLGFGNLAIEKGDSKKALQWYRKAEKKARKLCLSYLHSLTLINVGSANKELNKLDEAIDYYQKARKIAETEGYHYSLFLALKGEAKACLEKGEFEKAEKLFWGLYNLKKTDEDFHEMAANLHNVGVTLIKQKKYQQARRILGHALRLAKKNEYIELIFYCHLNSAFSYAEAGEVKKTLRNLKNRAQKEEKSGFYLVAAKLWENYIKLLIENNRKTDEIEKMFKRCIQCIERSDDNYPYLSRVYKLLYEWRWDNNFFMDAIDALKKLEKIAVDNNQFEDKTRAIDQRGICFQELGMFDKAEKDHRYALKLARRLNDLGCIKTSLQNLGEVLRKTHKLEDSISVSMEAEKIAVEINDIKAQISISHNRALTVGQTGNIRESEKILLQCRDKARKNKFWYEYVRAIRGLAYTAELEGKNKLAERRYLEALRQADVYGLAEYSPEIILDYSDFLSKEKRFEDAVKILEKQGEHFENSVDAHFYYMSLAKLYENKNNTDLAIKYWEEAKSAASLIGNQTIVSECIDSLERICRQEKESHLIEGELERDIQNENDPKQKSLLMVKYMNLLLSRGKERKAESIFKDTLKVVRKHDFIDIKIDIYMKYGDYLWQKSSRSQYKALQAYVVSVLDSISYEDSYEYYLKTCKYVIDKLLAIDPKKRQNRIKALYERLSVWLKKDFEKVEAQLEFDFIDYILWPLKVSIRLPAISKDGIFEYQIYEKIEEEMKDLNRLSDSD